MAAANADGVEDRRDQVAIGICRCQMARRAVYQLLTIRFAFAGIRVTMACHRNGGDSVINQIAERLSGAGSAMLRPASLIDRLLDQIERLGVALMPVQVDEMACQRIRIDPRID